MSGSELCRSVRQLDLPNYIYILFLTGRPDEDTLVSAIGAGADDFLKKPVRKAELLARLMAGSRILELEARLHDLADHDGLTGLLLRRPFERFSEQEWQRSIRDRLSLSAVMVDIDHFKHVNDIHGHPTGDAVIRHVANLMCESAGNSDIICRYGGEEFCILLPETDEASAMAWAERLRRRVADARISVGGTVSQVTISLGVAEMLSDMEDKDELLGLADQCLLAAKAQGRDQVVTLRGLSENGELIGAATDCGLNGVLARDAMIPLVHCLRREWPIVRAAAYFLQYRVTSAPVTDAGDNLEGIVADKDVLAIAHIPDAMKRRVADVMRSNVITYDEAAPLAQVLRFLTRASLRSVVITAAGRPSGLISRAALVRWFLGNASKSDRLGSGRSDGDAHGVVSADEDSALLRLADQLSTEANRLHRYLQSSQLDRDAAPIVGGTSRMQQLIDDLLAGAASTRPTGGGLPF